MIVEYRKYRGEIFVGRMTIELLNEILGIASALELVGEKNGCTSL
jgi:hypothetical protein